MMKRESEERQTERREREGLNSFSLCVMSNCTLRSNSKEEKGRICLLTGGDMYDDDKNDDGDDEGEDEEEDEGRKIKERSR